MGEYEKSLFWLDCLKGKLHRTGFLWFPAENMETCGENIETCGYAWQFDFPGHLWHRTAWCFCEWWYDSRWNLRPYRKQDWTLYTIEKKIDENCIVTFEWEFVVLPHFPNVVRRILPDRISKIPRVWFVYHMHCRGCLRSSNQSSCSMRGNVWTHFHVAWICMKHRCLLHLYREQFASNTIHS